MDIVRNLVSFRQRVLPVEAPLTRFVVSSVQFVVEDVALKTRNFDFCWKGH